MVHLRIKLKKRNQLGLMSCTKTQQLRLWFLRMLRLLCQRPQYEIIQTVCIRASQQCFPSNKVLDGPYLSYNINMGFLGFSYHGCGYGLQSCSQNIGMVYLLCSPVTLFQRGIDFRYYQHNISSYKS